jgi:KDO2-lipid IV(A) lauroyltransferase
MLRQRRRSILYWAATILFPIISRLGPRWFSLPAAAFGRLFLLLSPRRRAVTLGNLRRFFGAAAEERQLRRLARRSSGSLLMGVVENAHFRRRLKRPQRPDGALGQVEATLRRAQALHRQAGGCIFVTSHLGGYAMLPYLFSRWEIPLTVPINPARDGELQRRFCPLDAERAPGSEIFIAKKDSLEALAKALRQGRSVGLLADQRPTGKIVFDDSRGRVVTSPVAALLAIGCNRPIIAGACYRSTAGNFYEIKLCEPLWPDPSADEASEAARLTGALDAALATLIHAAPEQYLWMHHRWRPHRRRGAKRPATA